MIFLTIFPFPSTCRNQSIVIEEPSLCMNYSYVIPLFSTQILRMTFNRTRFKQLNIHTVHVRASIADRKVAEFDKHRHTIQQVFHLMNSTQGQYQ